MCNREKKGSCIMGIKDITDSAKKALEIANELKNIELKEAILELKEKMIELREENIELKEQLKEKQKYNMVFENNKYWNLKEDGSKEGPFCVTCWDYNQTASRLIDNYYCGICLTRKGGK